MQRLTAVIGNARDPVFSGRLHDLGHAGRVEYLVLDREDMQRRRLRATTDRGQDCAIALSRDDRLGDGAILLLDRERAVVVRSVEEQWLKLSPRDAAAALELGYFAGNLHWRARFDGPVLLIALEGAKSDYLERLKLFLEDGRARCLDDV